MKNLTVAEILKSQTTRLRKDSNFSHVWVSLRNFSNPHFDLQSSPVFLSMLFVNLLNMYICSKFVLLFSVQFSYPILHFQDHCILIRSLLAVLIGKNNNQRQMLACSRALFKFLICFYIFSVTFSLTALPGLLNQSSRIPPRLEH